MKKISIAFIIIPALLLNVGAQETGNRNAYFKDSKTISAGLNFGYWNYGYGTRTGFSLPFKGSFEYGIHEYFGLGGFIGYASWHYDDFWGGTDYKYTVSFLSIGVLGSLHYAPLLNEHLDMGIDLKEIDLYFSLLLGIENQFFNSNYEYANRFYDDDTEPFFGPVIGVKYMFSPNLGAYFETGYGLYGAFGLGVSYVF
jgi:hypothetical protein